jgi:hypothetical protein
MDPLDLPRAVIGTAVRVIRVPVDLVFGNGSEAQGATARPARETTEHPTDTAEQRQQADELRRAVDRVREEPR